MTVVIPMEDRFCRAPDQSLWTRGAHAYSFWQRYLTVFDRVRVVARVLDVAQPDARASRADGPGVEYAAVPYYVGPAQFLKRARAVRRAVRRAVQPADAVIMRVSGILSSLLEPSLVAAQHPYGLEVICDPYDVFAPGAVRSPLRPFCRWWFPRALRRQCSRAAGVSYVTNRTLQKSYPCGTYSIGTSDVELNEDSVVVNRPAFTTYYSSVQLGNNEIRGSRHSYDPHRRIELVTVGSLEQPYKGIDVLIQALARCMAAGIDMRLTVVGEGRYRTSLEQMAQRCGASSAVHFTGQLSPASAVQRVLDASDLFVLASRTEGLPRAMIEAMARGLPCIGTTVGGIPELLEPAELVPPNDARSLAAKILGTVLQPGHMTQLSNQNLMKAKEYRAEILDARRKQFFKHIRGVTEQWIEKQR